MPSLENIRVWHGVVFVRQGKYSRGIFKFWMDLSRYPFECPRIVFTSNVFNPLVNKKTGELDMSLQFPSWDRTNHFIALTLAYMKSIFYKASYWDRRRSHPPYNEDAMKL
jgi:ubiquitin-protein ligase